MLILETIGTQALRLDRTETLSLGQRIFMKTLWGFAFYSSMIGVCLAQDIPTHHYVQLTLENTPESLFVPFRGLSISEFQELQDANGNTYKGEFTFVGKDLYFLFQNPSNDLPLRTGHLIRIGYVDAEIEDLHPSDPMIEGRKFHLNENLIVINSLKVIQEKESGYIRATALETSDAQWQSIENYRRTEVQIHELRGKTFTFDDAWPASIGKLFSFPDYFGFRSLTVEEVYLMGGYWYLAVRTDKQIGEFSAQGFRHEKINFIAHFTENGRNIQLHARRPSLWRASQLRSSSFSPNAEMIVLDADKGRFPWPRVQRGIFCTKTAGRLAPPH